MEALVFEQEAGETIEDTTLPDITFQDSKIQSYVEDLTDIFGRVCFYLLNILHRNIIRLYFTKDPTTGTKRPSSSRAGEPNAKVPKVSSVSRDNIISAIQTGAVSSFKFHLAHILSKIIILTKFYRQPESLLQC